MKLPLSDSWVLSNIALEKLNIPAVSCGKISEAQNQQWLIMADSITFGVKFIDF